MKARISAAVAVLVVVASVTGVTALATPAAAQSDDGGLLGDIIGEDSPSILEDPSGWASAAWSAAGGAGDRVSYWVSAQTPDFLAELFPSLADRQTASDEAAAVTEYFNTHNGTLIGYANDRANWTSNHTVELAWTIQGDTATRYLLVNASDGNITSARIVSSTARTPGDDVELCGFAAASSREELGYFVDTFAEPQKNVTPRYRARLGSKYAGNVETSLYPSEGDCN